ncbi:MAG: hypothetical protein QXW00_00215 [Candidatus Woesearchaeota archaeon]
MILGINFVKISAENKKRVAGQLQVNNNVQIKGVENAEIGGSQKNSGGIKVSFTFTTTYTPDIGLIELEGELIAVEKKEVAESAVKEWKKSKTLLKELVKEIMDAILARATVEAVVISRELSLPPPIPFPRVNEQQSEQKGSNEYIG